MSGQENFHDFFSQQAGINPVTPEKGGIPSTVSARVHEDFESLYQDLQKTGEELYTQALHEGISNVIGPHEVFIIFVCAKFGWKEPCEKAAEICKLFSPEYRNDAEGICKIVGKHCKHDHHQDHDYGEF